MTEYRWREMPVVPRVDATVFGHIVEELASGGPPHLVPPKRIVDAARPRRSPIHTLFMWDNDRAGEQFRWMQARRYVSQLEVVLVEVKGSRAISTRGFWSVQIGKDRGYVPRRRVLSERDLKLQVIATARGELESYIRKYQSVLAFGGFIPRLQTIMDDMRRALDKLQAEAMRKDKKRADA
jgi:hypothetical protein